MEIGLFILAFEDDSEDRVDLDLSLEDIQSESVTSVTDVNEIPVFTDGFLLRSVTRLEVADVFIGDQLTRDVSLGFDRDVLFLQEISNLTAPEMLEDTDDLPILFLGIGFTLIALLTIAIMTIYFRVRRPSNSSNWDNELEGEMG